MQIHTKKRNKLDPKRLNDLVFVRFNRRMLKKRTVKSKSEKSKDVLVAPDDSRALHRKNPRVKERENEDK